MPEQGISAGHQAASWKDPFLGKGTQGAEVAPRNQAEEQRYREQEGTTGNGDILMLQ